MDKAPTIPRDKAIFPDITLVITKVIIGNVVKVVVCDLVFIQPCPDFSRINLKEMLKKKSRNILIISESI